MRFLLLIAAAALLVQPSAFAKHRDADRDDEIARAAYEQGYRDGYDRGYSDHGRRAALDYRCRYYDHADRGYRSDYGDRVRFQAAYRLAFRAGYGEGYRGRPRATVVISVIFAPGRHDECRDDDGYCHPPRRHHGHERDDDDDDDQGHGRHHDRD